MTDRGALYVVGIGPGSYEQMTIKAVKALEASQVIAGYTVYVDLIKTYFPDKEYLSTPMRQETQRCRLALEKAAHGNIVSMVCSGDSGIYGMSSLIWQLAGEYPNVEVSVIAGVTAASSGASLLGAPLGHDFAVISLSDLLTPMELIEKRLACAAQGDFIICLYNPASRKRADYLKRACEIVLQYQKPETICGIVKQIDREGQEIKVMTLQELRDYQADMFTTVYMGNSRTVTIGEKMVAPRGYRDV